MELFEPLRVFEG